MFHPYSNFNPVSTPSTFPFQNTLSVSSGDQNQLDHLRIISISALELMKTNSHILYKLSAKLSALNKSQTETHLSGLLTTVTDNSSTVCHKVILCCLLCVHIFMYVQSSDKSLPLQKNDEGNLVLSFSRDPGMMLHNYSLCYRLNVHNVTAQFVRSGLIVNFLEIVNSVYRKGSRHELRKLDHIILNTFKCLRILHNQAVKG